MSAIDRLVREFSRLPGVGPKTALRLVHHLLKDTPEAPVRLSQAVRELGERVRPCATCGNFSEDELCEVCSNPRRDRSLVCVVEEAYEVGAFERTGHFRGLFHVLGGRLSPLDGVGPDELGIDRLMDRLSNGGDSVDEVIIATSASVEGEATAVYLEGRIRPLGIRVTRLARGIPVGTDLEYVDGTTLSEALNGRREM